MRNVLNFFIAILKFLLACINFILIILIVLNIVLIISNKVLKSEYPSLMDYTYIIINDNDNYLNLKKDDIVILDIRKDFLVNDIVYYKEDVNKDSFGKIEEIAGEDVKLKNDKETDTTTKNLVIGTKIYVVPKVGSIVNTLLQPICLIIYIVILTITTLIQKFINKKTKISKEDKPNFNEMKRYN